MSTKDTPEIQLVRSDLNTYQALSAVANSEGGQILMKNLAKDIMSGVDLIAAQAGILQEQTLRAQGMKLAASLAMYRALSNADANMRDAQEELDTLLAA